MLHPRGLLAASPLLVTILLCFTGRAAATEHSLTPLRRRDLHGPHRQQKRALPSGWTSLGCMTDAASRTLGAYTFTSSTLTQESCIAGCVAKGYTYAGMEYYTECYCDNALGSAAGVAASSECNTSCAGDSTEACGGTWRINVFHRTSTATTTTSSPSTTPTTSSSLPPGWSLANACVVDSTSRVLAAYEVDQSAMTPSSCINACASQGYTLAGVQYGMQCYCASAYNGGTPTAASASDCNMPCAGDSKQTCGASWRMTIYSRSASTSSSVTTTATSTASTTSASATGWALANACVVDTSSRVLAAYEVDLAANTPALCMQTCASKGYTLAGVEYGNQCYCASSYNGGTPTAASASDCNMACAGDNTQKCGSSWRMTIYSKTATTTSSSSLSSATPSASGVPLPPGWSVAMACAVDSSSARVIGDYITTLSTNTPYNCAAFCGDMGYLYAGVQYGSECYCSTRYTNPPTAAATTDCSTPCAGDSKQTCGNGWRLQIYYQADKVNGLVAAPQYSLIDNYVGSGFLSGFVHENIADPTNGRVNYVDQSTALAQNLTFTTSDTLIMRADYQTVLSSSGAGRNSVRIRSVKAYAHHVAVFDIRHMPQGCGTWPAAWATRANGQWPLYGEVDIVEGVNDVGMNQITLHSSPSCTMPSSTAGMTGNKYQLDCNTAVNNNAGCGVGVPDARSYGPTFNANGGGWYVMERTSQFVKVWFWPRNGSPPSIIRNGGSTIDTSTFGTPVAYFPNTSCDIEAHFGGHNIIINLTFCGDWAGNTYGSSGCPSSCVDYVNNNPAAFANAYWDIAAVRVYQ